MKDQTQQSLHDCPFIQLVAAHASKTISDAMPKDAAVRQKTPFNRDLTTWELHTNWTLIAASELLNVCDQMAFASQLLSGYRSDQNGESFMSRFDYLRYQIENHLIRTGMIVDRALHLINVVFDLGIPQRDCKFSVVAKNFHVAASGVGIATERLRKSVQSVQAKRNLIAHKESYADDELSIVEMHSVLQKSSNVDPDSDSALQIAAHLAKVHGDAFVQRKRSEMQTINATVFTNVFALFEELIQPYISRYQRLTNLS